jgi:hippurate hydrolase
MMIADGLFNRFPKPDLCIALHVQHDKPAGTAGYKAGWAAANVDSVDITIFGKGGHGAKPHTTVDPIVVAAHTITSLQTLVSRRVDPIEPAVVTVGSIHGGTKHNIIPGEVKMQLTVRSYTDEIRKSLLDGIRQIATDTARVFQCPKPPEIVVKDEYTPACYNDPELTTVAAGLFRKLLGDDKVYENPPTMGGEDFGTYARDLKVPGLQYSVGSVSREKYAASLEPGAEPLPSLHSALYAPDPEPTIRTSVETMTNLALALLKPGE